MTQDSGRRPIASRNTKWAAHVTDRLVQLRVAPNHISVASLIAALLSGAAFALSPATGPGWGAALLVLGAALCQLRLLCNLFDGLVAVEGGLGTPDGAFWNEIPDRLSDLLILAGFGMAAGAPALGLLAAALAILTAYLREFGRASGFEPDFSGPGAKSHRMAVVIAGALLQAGALIAGSGWPVASWALWLVVLLAGLTGARRSLHVLRGLRDRAG
ncbi:Phosphatidylglycerophosphate synthase [Paracoccus halophilus]|uniref:CDP-diacylglycerol--glycerol-3-phosphate 3-phosphatidyltransferase n=1 Tax=Paracoccus halophilus TaxID=376733 RepID=A0A099F8G5_9RHOB|nr:CDP-alcohol phosphatidyltransferase family protein [Paracoccus halophilus]KGJ06834.1 CDP-diacylglycerol--glycerol-3-phosphate 3-phosphatidyltransferase [Paracoccus halophilus]SFA41241.1 Phosphatidylglycerophosphate synthase [Paracoccus halophilus]